MSVFSSLGRAHLRPDRRNGPEFSDAILCEAACQAIVDALYGEGALAAPCRDNRRL
ncbi:hypothetical protein LAZ40_15915 [Cereibacter sphaeroides]|uniref:hypothetical protein n=1 Tax=Rhodobacterales TaxID=204455 RepID=UPI0012FD928D|nr:MULTISPECIES: hypothetical protein [Paracoccaceae]MCE6960512.1 hypothetical protein [Cereibacter sphaeroides]MCE6969462.1 hypothetical protein [Cereibacter sphaeroides]MCE6975520.1 hypothetical protein [Cereibacter sphaeroides]